MTRPASEGPPAPTPQNSLGALAASRRPSLRTTPATPNARRRRSFRRDTLVWAAAGLLLSLVPVGVQASRNLPERDEKPKRELTPPQVLHGAAEIKRAPNGEHVRWRRGKTSIHIDASVERYGRGAREAVQTAFGTWHELGTNTPQLTFDTAKGTKLSLEPDGKNSVLVAPIDLPGHENDLAITLAFWDERTGAIAEADIVINAKADFALLASDEGTKPANVQLHRQCSEGAYDLQNVLTHEVGHFMGLGEELHEDDASMYFRSHRCETQKRTLAASDQHSVLTLYAAPASENTEAEASAGCTFRGGGRGTGSALALATSAALAFIGLRRSR